MRGTAEPALRSRPPEDLHPPATGSIQPAFQTQGTEHDPG